MFNGSLGEVLWQLMFHFLHWVTQQLDKCRQTSEGFQDCLASGSLILWTYAVEDRRFLSFFLITLSSDRRPFISRRIKEHCRWLYIHSRLWQSWLCVLSWYLNASLFGGAMLTRERHDGSIFSTCLCAAHSHCILLSFDCKINFQNTHQVVEALGARLTTIAFRDEVEKGIKQLGKNQLSIFICCQLLELANGIWLYRIHSIHTATIHMLAQHFCSTVEGDTEPKSSASHVLMLPYVADCRAEHVCSNSVSRSKQRCRVVAIGKGDKGAVATLVADKKEAKWHLSSWIWETSLNQMLWHWRKCWRGKGE